MSRVRSWLHLGHGLHHLQPEIKNDLNADGFCTKAFFATEAAFLAVLFAYNLLALYQAQVTKAFGYRKPSTLRAAVFVGGASSSDTIQLLNGASGDFAFFNNVINLTLLAGSFTDGQQFTLFDGTADNQFAGLTTDGGGKITAGLSFAGLSGAYQTESYLSLSNGDILLNVVPEPATWMLLAFSLTTVMVLRRRRRM